MKDSSLCYSAKELAILLKLQIKTIYEGAARGEIPSRRVGRRVLFPKPAIDDWLKRCGKES